MQATQCDVKLKRNLNKRYCNTPFFIVYFSLLNIVHLLCKILFIKTVFFMFPSESNGGRRYEWRWKNIIRGIRAGLYWYGLRQMMR